MLNNLFNMYGKEFNKKKRLLLDTFTDGSISIETKVITSYGRLGFILNLKKAEPIDLMYHIVRHGFSALPTVDTIRNHHKDNIPKSHIFGVKDELPNRLTRDNTVFLYTIDHDRDKWSKIRLEFYPSDEVFLENILDNSTRLYISYHLKIIRGNFTPYIEYSHVYSDNHLFYSFRKNCVDITFPEKISQIDDIFMICTKKMIKM